MLLEGFCFRVVNDKRYQADVERVKTAIFGFGQCNDRKKSMSIFTNG